MDRHEWVSRRRGDGAVTQARWTESPPAALSGGGDGHTGHHTRLRGRGERPSFGGGQAGLQPWPRHWGGPGWASSSEPWFPQLHTRADVPARTSCAPVQPNTCFAHTHTPGGDVMGWGNPPPQELPRLVGEVLLEPRTSTLRPEQKTCPPRAAAAPGRGRRAECARVCVSWGEGL